MNRSSLHLTVLAAGLALVFAAVASGDLSGNRKVWCAGNVCVADDGGIAPSKLPRHAKAPITARLNAEISTRDGSHPPAFQSMDLDVDRTISLDAVGLPACRAKQIEARATATAKRACGEAIVGSGEAEVEVAFPEQPPFRSSGPLVLFNGGVKGRTTTLLLHAYVDVPAPTAIVTRATITRIHEGRFGLNVKAKVPKIAGGSGSVTTFDLRVGRKFTYRGKRKSFLTASCPTGTWMAKGDARFVDGTRLSIAHAFPCTPEG